MSVVQLPVKGLDQRLELLLLQIERNCRAGRLDVAVTNFTHALHLAHQVPDSDRLRALRRELCRSFGGFNDPDGGGAA